MLLSAGSNARGQLGNGSVHDAHTFSTCVFEDISPNHRILDLACGANHTLLLIEITRETGDTVKELWGSGDGTAGQFGPMHKEEYTTFRRLDIPHGQAGYAPKLICASWQSSFIVLSCPGKPDLLISMGGNDWGDLGGSPFGERIPGMELVPFGSLKLEEPSLAGDITLNAIAAGPHHVICSVSTANTSRPWLVGWGAARHGQLGDPRYYGQPTPIERFPKVIYHYGEPQSFALGAQHTAILLTSGQPIGHGSNRKHQMTDLRKMNGVRMVGCTWNGIYAVTDDGIVSKGLNSKGQLGHGEDSPTVEFPFSFTSRSLKKLACGSEHVVTLFDDGEVWGWGWNEHGNLGVGTTEDIIRPVKIWLDASGKDVNIWAGPGTTWIAVQ
ncbi:RCC1/BLIP-II [Hymenopellis radicata]|nr:RCC1/BLIP-II [Hymenopellis radicata]